MRNIAMLFLSFIIYAFFGWCMEVIVTIIEDKKIINRGFLIGPLCPIYGVGVNLIIFLLTRYMNDPIVLFVMSVFICSLLEYFTSYIMEKIFKARWWDYTDRKYNINGRICLENLAAFGLLGSIILYIVNPFVSKLLSKLPFTALIILSSILFIIFITDVIVSFKIISGFKNVAKSMKKDNTEEITKKVRELLIKRGGLYKRLMLAFQNFQASDLLLKITDQIKEKASVALDKLEIIENENKKHSKNIKKEKVKEKEKKNAKK